MKRDLLRAHSLRLGLMTLCSLALAGCAPALGGSNEKLLGVYYNNWIEPAPRIKDVNPAYNLIYLFAATAPKNDTTGAIKFTPPEDSLGARTNWANDIQYARSQQGRKIILSVGGAEGAMDFPDRAKSKVFVNSVDELYTQWKGFDGLDFNTYEGRDPNTSEMIWIAKELKRRHPGFLITSPPAPWNKVDQQFCKDMLDAGALDFCAPQYYDGPDLADPKWIIPNAEKWMKLLGARHVVIGFGVDPSPEVKNYETIGVAVSVWRSLKQAYPATRGSFVWKLGIEEQQGNPFAKQMGPLVR